MPMIDVYAEKGVFHPESLRALGAALAQAVLRAEGVKTPTPFHLKNTACFLHLMEPDTINTASDEDVRRVRVQIITPPGALNRAGQIEFVREASRIIADYANDPSQVERTWVVLSEAVEGGWGIAGTAYGKEEFIALFSKSPSR